MYIAHITKLEKLVDCLVHGVPNIKSVGMFGYEFGQNGYGFVHQIIMGQVSLC